MNGNPSGNGCVKQKKCVQELGFSLIEIGLYLDSHPCCKEALEAFSSLRAQYLEAVKHYEANCGPLTFLEGGGNCYTWVQTPWPWEKEAN